MTNRFPRCVAFGVLLLVLTGMGAHAQELEPRSYSNTPVGLNFLIAGYFDYHRASVFNNLIDGPAS